MLKFKAMAAVSLCAALCGLAAACKSAPAGSSAPAAAAKAPEVPEMVMVPAGTFTMGSPSEELHSFHDERPQHEITLAAFYIGKYPVTQKVWRDVMGDSPSHFHGDELPVEQVSWYDALIFCNKLSEMNGFSPAYRIKGSASPADWGPAPAHPAHDEKWDAAEIAAGADGYRLPTEAQWEYACRAGTSTPFNIGDNVSSEQANYDGRFPYKGHTVGAFRERTTTVGTFEPNAWGLYDMHGNVWEWCWDWHGNYAGINAADPQGLASGTYRIARGGSWINNGRFLRSAARGNSAPAFREQNLGLRVVRPQ